MDHPEAIRLSAVEKYLLNELSPDMRDAFEDHYFDCKECMTDLQATTAFMDAAREEFKSHPVETLTQPAVPQGPLVMKSPFPQPVPAKRLSFFQKPMIAGLALAASLLVIVYQNVVVYPHLQSEVAELRAPEILPALSLAGANSRGETTPSITVKASHPFLLSVDIPAEDRFQSYTCELHAPSGEVLWRMPVSAEAAKDLVTIHAPAMHGSSGRYVLVVLGNANSNGNSGAGGIELARDTFDLSIQR